MDLTSLEIISRFKLAVLANTLPTNNSDINRANRGSKLDFPTSSLDGLKTKVVEYDGVNHLVLTNDCIERSNLRKKRKWKEFYGAEASEATGATEESADSESGSESDDDEDDHPFKKIKFADILSPLNHPSEIISHPAILRTFKLQIFNRLATELIELIEVEQVNLNWLNKLLQVLNGEDWFYLLEENLGLKKYDHGLNEEKDTPVVASDEEVVKDPFFALPDAVKKYEAHQIQQESSDEFTNLKDDLINYLQVSIQRQNEYIKNLSQLRNGIVRADRLKRDLYKWGKEMYEKKSSWADNVGKAIFQTL